MTDILAELLAKLDTAPAALPAIEKALESVGAFELKWRPDPRNKPQVEAFHSQADILLYGGAAGGGKTDLIIGLAMTEHERSVVFRAQFKDLAWIETRILQMNGGRNGWKGGTDKVLTLPDRSIELGHLGMPGSEMNWMGRPHDFIGIDEGAQIPGERVRFVIGWLRTTKPGQRRRVVIGSNPPIGGEGEWLIEWFGPWLDPAHELYGSVAPGELLWAVVSGQGETIWVEGPGDYLIEGEGNEPIMAMSRTFIPSLLSDNPYLGADYRANIMQLQEPLRSKLLNGDFTAGREDHPQQVIPMAWVLAANARHKRGRPQRQAMTAIAADVAQGGTATTCISRLWGSWFDELIRIPGKQTPDGQSVAAQLIQHRRGAAVITIDLTGGWGISARDHLKNLDIAIVPCVFSSQKNTGRTKDQAWRYGNRRAQMYWQFREALDPDSGEEISLPVDARLTAQLTTVRFKLKGDTLFIEDKQEIQKRLGMVSIDDADAIVMAWWARSQYGINAANQRDMASSAPTSNDLDDW